MDTVVPHLRLQGRELLVQVLPRLLVLLLLLLQGVPLLLQLANAAAEVELLPRLLLEELLQDGK